LPARLRLELRDQSLHLRILAIAGNKSQPCRNPADSAVDSGKTRFRPRKASPRRWKPDWNQHLEPVAAIPADRGNRAAFAVVGSGRQWNSTAYLVIAEFDITRIAYKLI
jgi:hypothetical protein